LLKILTLSSLPSLAEFLIFTGFLAAAYALQVPKGYNQENLILGLIYAWFCIFMIFNYIPTSTVTVPWMRFVRCASRPIMRLSKFKRNLFYGLFVTAVIVITVFSLPESPDSTRLQRLVALFGLFVFFAALWLTSTVSFVFI
jgi:CNT family concentrative nucleoside transporter